jgi:hypothetical protein
LEVVRYRAFTITLCPVGGFSRAGSPKDPAIGIKCADGDSQLLDKSGADSRASGVLGDPASFNGREFLYAHNGEAQDATRKSILCVYLGGSP